MPTLTFDQIRERVAEHQAAEAARDAPLAVAHRAVFELSSALVDLSAADRASILALLKAEVLALPVTAQYTRTANGECCHRLSSPPVDRDPRGARTIVHS